MKRFFTVFEFEFFNYLKNKSFVITTVLFALLLGVIMCLPSLVDVSDLPGVESESATTGEAMTYGMLDESGYFSGEEEMQSVFGENCKFLFYEKEDALKKAVEEEEIEAGFFVTDTSHYRYIVKNHEWADDTQEIFESYLTEIHRQEYCMEHGLDYGEVTRLYQEEVTCDIQVLGKDMEDNYWYCYMLVMLIFILVMLYGSMIATSVVKEKSNRSIEMLVTSIHSNCLLFGKVFAGVAAVVTQVAIVLGVALTTYQINRSAWNNKLDMIFYIPADVLAAFAIFGIGGFLFYAFLFGALGALVSKTEDINNSTGLLNMILMLIYFIVMFQLDNVDGILMKVCSYLPFSSYSAMFVRIGMGKVESWEVILSAVILYVSIVGAGWIGAKIYRLGTLRYGNPIKISRALKELLGDS